VPAATLRLGAEALDGRQIGGQAGRQEGRQLHTSRATDFLRAVSLSEASCRKQSGSTFPKALMKFPPVHAR
jgi:hypothetical protein